MANNGNFRPMKWLVLLVLAAAGIGGGYWYYSHRDNSTPEYQTTVITRGDLTQAVTATGQLNPVTNVTVGSQISGNIQKLYADFNTPVKSGQVVAELDAATYKAAVAMAEGDLANTKANLELNKVEAGRATELLKNKLISQSDYDKAAATLHQSEAQVMMKEASLQRARVDLSRCTIYAPVDGIVISRNVDVGQTVAASMSAPTLFVIANDLTRMQIDANVAEADIGSIEEGQNVSFTVDAFLDRKFSGRVKQIRNAPTTVQNVVTYDVVIEVSNPELKLRPGMTANASIITAERSGALKIPNAALRFRLPETAAGKESKPAGTNTTRVARAIAGSNATEVVANTAPITGNESPEELQKRVNEMRARGEEIPPEVRTRLRAFYQSGALQRPAGGQGGQGGPRGGGGGSGGRASQPSTRTIYTVAANKSGDPAPQPVHIKTGINDGANTEVTDGLKEGDVVIIGIKPSANSPAMPVGGASPFGGPGGGGGFRRGF
jgi:HlyD family secretion protein